MPAPRILIIRGGALGDFIVTVPLLDALRRRWPNGNLELMAYPHATKLAEGAELVTTTSSLDDARMARYFIENAPVREQDLAYFRSFQIILNLLNDPGGVLSENLRRCGAPLVVAHSPIVTEGHAIDHFLKALEPFPPYKAVQTPSLTVRKATCFNIPEPLSPWVAIHPGSGGLSKNWPIDRFIELADRIIGEKSLIPVFITGEVEKEHIPGLDQLLGKYMRFHQLEITDLASVISGARLYIGNDAGTTHLAAATGCSTLALFGPTDCTRWAPRGRDVRVITSSTGEMRAISVGHVWSEVMKMICTTA